jgi:hypothetical protein
VDPDRVLADHGFARRLLRRAGAAILVGPGPLVVAPDLARGLPSNPAVRAGRALALQLLGVRLAIAQGMAPDQVIMEVVPGWLLGEPAPYTRAAAEIALRRALLPDCPLAFAEPSEPSRAQAWAFLLGAVLPPAPAAALILRAPSDGAFAATALATRAAAAVAAEVGAARQPAQLHGLALQHALATTVVATETIEQLRSHGWTAVIGEGMTGQLDSGGWIGRGPASVARSRSPFDPLGDALGHPLGPGVAPAR